MSGTLQGIPGAHVHSDSTIHKTINNTRLMQWVTENVLGGGGAIGSSEWTGRAGSRFQEGHRPLGTVGGKRRVGGLAGVWTHTCEDGGRLGS